MNMKSKKIWILFSLIFFIALFSNTIFSDTSNIFETPRKCSDIWTPQSCNSTTLNDANFGGCNGTQSNSNWPSVSEVYINATNFLPDSGINVTCEFVQNQAPDIGYTYFEYVWYWNSSNWINIQNWTNQNYSMSGHPYNLFNRSVAFKLNSSEGEQRVRCILYFNTSGTPPSNECANSTPDGKYDNDDVNFTVTSHLTYNFWNLTNSTTSEAGSGGTYNRSHAINISANWNKNISYAEIEINGTGTPRNYTISSPYTGNWTNYTINLSDATKYNQYNITINTIYVNDTFSVTNNTSPLLFFYLDIGLEPPNISSYWFQPLTNRTNLYTNLTIYANVSDDSGISTVRANLTYPDNTSVILNLTGDPNPGNQTWNYTFRTTGFTLNEAGNYTVSWVSVKDNGNREVNLTQNLTFYVTNNLTVNVSVPSSTPGKGTPINPVSISIFDVSNNYHQFLVNLTVRCLNISYVDTNFSLANVNGQTTLTNCYAPDSYSTPFNITVNATDSYNNTGENYKTLTTTDETTTIISGGGGSGGFAPSAKEKPKNCTDGTLYDQCSAKRPYYCSNGTLTRKCSICGCDNSDYGCQPDGYCALIKEEDFNFNLSAARLEIKQGGDKEITGVLKNTGNTVLELMSFYNASEHCCNISMPPSFELKEKEEKVFTISIHAPLFAVVGDYPNTTISIGTSLFRKDKTIDIIVGQSQHYNSLSELENELADIENKIQEVKKAGIDTSNLEAMVEKSRALLQNANSSIAGDQIDVLSASLANLTSNNQLVESRLGGLRNQAFLLQNAWLIGLFVVMSFTTMYMVPQVLLPLNKKEKELSELKEEEETLVLSRVETEKQYFMRKIDENTFSKIMIGKQDRILKLRAQIRERENERIQLIKAVSPLAMATWFANGIKGIPKKIKNSPKSILNRKNKNNIDSNGKTQ